MSPNSTEQAGAETPEARTHDAYTPESGDTSFDVEAYALDLSYRVRTNRLEGCATLSIRIVVATSSIALDLVGLRVSRVTLAGPVVRAPTRLRRPFRCRCARPVNPACPT